MSSKTRTKCLYLFRFVRVARHNFLACALGHQACRLGLSVRYAKVSRLLLELTQAKADGSYAKTLSALSNIQLLILDDWGMQPLSEAHRYDLMAMYSCT